MTGKNDSGKHETMPDGAFDPSPEVRIPAVMRMIERELNRIAQLTEVVNRIKNFDSTRSLEHASKNLEQAHMWLKKTRESLQRHEEDAGRE